MTRHTHTFTFVAIHEVEVKHGDKVKVWLFACSLCLMRVAVYQEKVIDLKDHTFYALFDDSVPGLVLPLVSETPL